MDLKIFAGTASIALGRKVTDSLGIPLGKSSTERFSDGELRIDIAENVRGSDCFVIQSTSAPANENLMELLILLDALRRSSPSRLTAVIPYFGYARQDKQGSTRSSITAKLVADMIVKAGANRVLAMDLHSQQIQGFFEVPVDNLYAKPVLVEAVRDSFPRETVTVVSPDAGGVVRAREFAKALGAPMAIIDKRRDKPNHCEIMNVVGEVRGRNCVVVDDMVDTAGTLRGGVEALRAMGASAVLAVATHPVLSGKARQNVVESRLDLVTTDTIALAIQTCAFIRTVSISGLLGEAIRRTHNEESISSLFR